MDQDISDLRSAIALSLTEVTDSASPFQSVTLLAVGSGVVLTLAIVGKLKVKDGKWELVEGLPGFEKLAKLFPFLFSG